MNEVEGLPKRCRVFETSGSMGEPVGIVHSEEGLRISAEAVNRHLEVDEGSCWALALPRRHVGGYGVVVRAEVAGCRMVEREGRWNPEAFAEWLSREKVTHTSLVPTQVHDLVRAGLKGAESLQAVVVGGGRLDEATGQAARDLGWPVLASYGLTEAGSQVATSSLDSLGKPFRAVSLSVLPIWDVRIGDMGGIQLRGPALFIGRVETGNDGRKYFTPRSGEWFETRDLGELDAKGHLMVAGRADQIVKILGELVDPLTIERELNMALPAEFRGQIAVIAVPDARAGHRLVAVREGQMHPSVAEATLARWNRKSPGYARISRLVSVNKFPRSLLGKLQRGKLFGMAGR